jgi:hypothetical protein
VYIRFTISVDSSSNQDTLRDALVALFKKMFNLDVIVTFPPSSRRRLLATTEVEVNAVTPESDQNTKKSDIETLVSNSTALTDELAKNGASVSSATLKSSPSVVTSSPSSDSDSDNNNTAIIAGAVAGGVVLAVIVVLVVVKVVGRSRSNDIQPAPAYTDSSMQFSNPTYDSGIGASKTATLNLNKGERYQDVMA